MSALHNLAANTGKFIREAVFVWFKDGAPSMGAALAFYHPGLRSRRYCARAAA
jgi:hypothetical protein